MKTSAVPRRAARALAQASSKLSAQIASQGCDRNAIPAAQCLERIGGDLEKLRPAESAHLAGRRKMRFEAHEAAIAASMQIDQDRLELPVAFAGGNDLPAAEPGVFYMNLRR